MSSEQIQNTSKSERIAKGNDGIEFMLKLFEAAGQRLFPRKMTTVATEGRMFTVCSKEDMLDACIKADFQDCRINGYPMMSDDDIDAGLVSPNILFFDLDKGDKTREEIDLLLEATIDRLRLTFNAQPGNFPVAVLWTGKGYHVYVIMKTKPLMIYKKMAELCIIAKTEISKEFLRFTEKYFTDYKSDINHNITFRSCLLRIPGTLNSDNLEEVKVIREPIGSVGFIMQQNDVLQKEFDYYCINIYRLYVKERKRQHAINKRMNRNRKSIVSNSKRYLWIKQSQQEQQPEVGLGLDITPTILLRQYELLDTFLQTLRTNNKESGLDPTRNAQYVPDIELISRKKISKFIKQATNKAGNWNTKRSLANADIINSIDETNYEHAEYPVLQLSRLSRVKAGDKEFLTRIIKLTCLDKGGNIISTSYNGLDSYTIPTVVYEFVPKDPDSTSTGTGTITRSSDDEDDNTIRVAHVRYDNRGGEPIGKKVYLQPYSAEKVHQILKETPPVGNNYDDKSTFSLCFHKVGESSPVITLNSVEEFTTPDFVGLWKEKRTPAPQINVSSKAILADFVKGQELKQVYG